MQYLLDSHTFLWYISGSGELSSKAKEIIGTPDSELLISIASLWEISLKHSLGKLEIKGTYDSIADDLTENDIEILPIDFIHTKVQTKLHHYHKDPFDRIIIAQALSENIDIISKDEIFDLYFKGEAVQRIW